MMQCLPPIDCSARRTADGLTGPSEQNRNETPRSSPVGGVVRVLGQHPSLLKLSMTVSTITSAVKRPCTKHGPARHNVATEVTSRWPSDRVIATIPSTMQARRRVVFACGVLGRAGKNGLVRSGRLQPNAGGDEESLVEEPSEHPDARQ